MPCPGRGEPSPFLLEPRYWQSRLAKMETVSRGLLLMPRGDLSSPGVEVVEWRLRAHDGTRLWGLRGTSPFHPLPRGARVREVSAWILPEVSLDTVAEGRADFVFQVPAGRRLEDRVLDVLRVFQVARTTCGIEPEQIDLSCHTGRQPDEFMIANRLLEQGLGSLP